MCTNRLLFLNFTIGLAMAQTTINMSESPSNCPNYEVTPSNSHDSPVHINEWNNQFANRAIRAAVEHLKSHWPSEDGVNIWSIDGDSKRLLAVRDEGEWLWVY